ncbi:hypothetical protein ACI7YT_12400 [Microbacterium sp. M]|uniref:hypothetical protein n=1 Tax=Microbacterium sp. M TaxID=3377125 RepID=UPI00386CE61A
MAWNRHELEQLIAHCNEVRDMASELIDEGNGQQVWDGDKRAYRVGPQWPYHGGTKLSGAFRRRTLDLTRLLAEVRKP